MAGIENNFDQEVNAILQGLKKLNDNTVNQPGIPGDSISWMDEVMNKSTRYSPEVRERAVRMVLEHQGGRIAVGRHWLDRREDWVYGADLAQLGRPGRA
jgi:hypothetical protein